jgi:20S proteasome alpha/beta subunit
MALAAGVAKGNVAASRTAVTTGMSLLGNNWAKVFRCGPSIWFF